MSMFLYWGAQNWTQYSRCFLRSAKVMRRITSMNMQTDAAQEAAAYLWHRCALLALGPLAVYQSP